MVEVRECHHIGERIRGERLSSRSCVVPATLQLKIPAARYNPSMSDGRSGEETREGRQRGILTHSLTHPASSLLPCFSGTHTCQSACSFFLFFACSVAVQPLRLLLCSGGGSEFLVQHTVQSGTVFAGLHNFPPEGQEFPLSQIPQSWGIRKQHIPLMSYFPNHQAPFV